MHKVYFFMQKDNLKNKYWVNEVQITRFFLECNQNRVHTEMQMELMST